MAAGQTKATGYTEDDQRDGWRWHGYHREGDGRGWGRLCKEWCDLVCVLGLTAKVLAQGGYAVECCGSRPRGGGDGGLTSIGDVQGERDWLRRKNSAKIGMARERACGCGDVPQGVRRGRAWVDGSQVWPGDAHRRCRRTTPRRSERARQCSKV